MKKYNFFVINPISIVGDILIRGIARGFEELGHNVISYDVREIDEQKVKDFNPDYVLGLDFAHLVNEKAEKFVKSLDATVLYYFIDDPHTNFAHSGDLTLFDKLKEDKTGIVYSWDSKYLDSFEQKTHYLPVGIDTELYKPNDIKTEKAKIVFTGRPLTDRRESVVAQIVKNFPGMLHIYSYEKHFEKSVENMKTKGFLNDEQIERYKKCYKGFLKSEQELAAVYHNSDIILNITMEQGATSMNYRVLEVMASGAALLTDYIEDTAKYFEEDKELVFYRDLDDLVKKVQMLLDYPDLRKKISGKGQQKVQKEHTLLVRAKQIIEVL